jgi:hypothetical protein
MVLPPFSQPFYKNAWNVLPSGISVSKYLGDNFSFGVQGSVNKIDKYVNLLRYQVVIQEEW